MTQDATATEITHRIVPTNGINLHIAEAGSGPLVLLLHGWPESWYSWRHQLPALAQAGYHAVAPDVRGYGQSDKPYPVEAYAMKEIVADFVGLLDALGEEKAVVVGHDWGAPMAWTSAILHPERYRAVAGLSVAHTGRSPAPPVETMRQIFGDNFFYIVYFQDEGVAEKEFEADPKRSLRLILWTASGDAPPMPAFAGKPKTSGFLDGIVEPEQLPSWLTEADIDFYAGEFKRSGFRGGINRYRNMDRDWRELPQLEGARITQPALFIAGEKDGVIAMQPGAIDTLKGLCDDFRGSVLLPGAGHWTQQERPAEVNKALIDFLNGL
jgi:pimeloyl-ACP methyl ester carboxylesterase